MPRGCVITIIILCVLMLIVSIVFYVVRWPDIKRQGTSQSIQTIEQAMEAYKSDYGMYPDGDNGAIAALLLGDNSREKRYLSKKTVVLRDGEFIDFWKRPIRFGSTDGQPRGLSAGKNGMFGDEDDISSQLVRDIVRLEKEKRAREAAP